MAASSTTTASGATRTNFTQEACFWWVGPQTGGTTAVRNDERQWQWARRRRQAVTYPRFNSLKKSLPDRFHAELGIFERFDFLDAMLGEVGQFGVVARLVATHAFWGLGEDVHADTARILWVVLSRSATNLVCRAGKFRSHAFPPGKWDNALATRQDKIGVSVNFLYCSDGPV